VADVAKSIRVLLVDDDALVRSGLRLMLDGAAGINVVGEASDGREVLASVDRHHPDVVLMDIRMPELDGVAATQLLRAQPSPPSVLVLPTFDADELVLRALRAGADGFLLKDTPPTDIVRAIEAVAAGEAMLSPAIAQKLINMVAGEGGTAERAELARERLATLSPREHEVALAVGRGCSNAEIAAELHMSIATVKAHVSRLLEKLDAANRVQVALTVQDGTHGQVTRSALRGQALREADAASNPRAQLALGPGARRLDEHPPLHRPPGHVEDARVWARERLVGRVRADTHHQFVARNPDRHIAAEQEGEPAEHRLLGYGSLVRELLAHAVREVVVVCHYARNTIPASTPPGQRDRRHPGCAGAASVGGLYFATSASA
jgi:DNA-binding NarL/FixJ family response regulator